ncbi:hypothetical protein HA402_007062 [Bradysia odoriphaga]|nr:hypothetical protein HA402_007062 [Bradysia odoriphaga]
MVSLYFVILFSTVLVATIKVSSINAIECGTINLYREAVLGGKEVVKDEWPFIVALYYSSTFKYFCGGTIISDKHVLTAAHCIQTKGKGFPLIPDEITVRLGAYNLTDRSEKDAVNRNVAQILLHPNWNVVEDKYDADIAILVLNETLYFSDHIRPICMPPRKFLIEGLKGTVVGWGKTENGTAEGIPKKIDVTALNDEVCYETDDGIASFASERSFCGESSGSPNEGDSGGGFFAVAGSGWVQFGTVSFIRPKGTGNNLNVALYMKLSSLRDWIADKVEQSGGNISLATTKSDLNCLYGSTVHAGYVCWLDDLNIRQENFVVKSFIGSHDFGKDNDDVRVIMFRSGVMASLPRNFGNIFRNLRFLAVTVNITRISRSDLENLERLEEIFVFSSTTAELDENSLWELPNLRLLQLVNTKLKFLHADTFSRNVNLLQINIASGALKTLPQNLFLKNLRLESAFFDENSIETIDENLFEKNVRLREVSLRGNRLRHLSENLFRNNPELQRLDLSNNRIKTIDEGSFSATSKLIYLNFGFNELEFLPEYLLQGVESLVAIFLSGNALKTIGTQFFETNLRLEKVLIALNQLTHIPAELFRNNSQLNEIDADGNLIETIDEKSFEKNSLLETVSLSSNILAEFPVDLFRHNLMLESVRLSENSPQELNESLFEWNTRLRNVYLSGNYVARLPEKLFQNNSLLEIVHFAFNSLQEIGASTFKWNAYLRDVSLNNNKLSYLPDSLFHHNPLLEIVDLSSNLFTTLNESIFIANANLAKINLQKCKIETLPRNLFQANLQLKQIDLSENKLKFIEIDFSVFKHGTFINLDKNDLVFSRKGESFILEHVAKNKTELRSVVMEHFNPEMLDPSENEKDKIKH